MKNFRILLLAALALVSCGKNTSVTGIVKDAPEASLTLQLLDVNRFQVLDTVKTAADGSFKYALDLEEPAFVYLFHGDRQIASLLLQKGDNVKVETDTLGAYRTEGSEDCLKLQKVENAYNAFLRDLGGILTTNPNPDQAISRRYVEYYRDRVAFVMQNSKSFAVVPVFFQQVNPTLPVFSNATDGFIMNSIADSLSTVCPDSRWIKALRKEADRRMEAVKMDAKLKDAQEVGYIDIDLPGMEGKNIKLSEVESKVTMVYFWASTAEQKMFNISSLLPIYEEFHPKGLEIYAIALDTDKSSWAAAIKNQKLPWVNVCDIRGTASPYVQSYGIASLPMLWIIRDGEIDPVSGLGNIDALKAYLRKNLR